MNKKLARASIKEEKSATRAYTQRIPKAKGKLKTVLKHNLKEEREHIAALKPHTRRKK